MCVNPTVPARQARRPRRLTKRAALFAKAITGLRQAEAAIETAIRGRPSAVDVLTHRGEGVRFLVELALSALESDCPPEATALLSNLTA